MGQYIDCETYYRTQKLFLSTTQIHFFDEFFKTLADALKEHFMSKNEHRAQFEHSDKAFSIANTLEPCLEKIRSNFQYTLLGKDENTI